MLMAEWKQVPTAMFQHLVENLPRRVEALIAAKGAPLHINVRDFGMRCSTSMCLHTFGHVVYIRALLQKSQLKSVYNFPVILAAVAYRYPPVILVGHWQPQSEVMREVQIVPRTGVSQCYKKTSVSTIKSFIENKNISMANKFYNTAAVIFLTILSCVLNTANNKQFTWSRAKVMFYFQRSRWK